MRSVLRSVSIEEIAIDAENRLLVRPLLMPSENFAHIYRDASGVAWIENVRSLGAREPQKWTHVELFKQILAAVRNEYGNSLVLTPKTRWSNVPDQLQSELRTCA